MKRRSSLRRRPVAVLQITHNQRLSINALDNNKHTIVSDAQLAAQLIIIITESERHNNIIV